ncbi:unnamed protein product [Coregonus sp. 'balchen']|nr:unnamed protein product [Coregonus sp. 'balchen']
MDQPPSYQPECVPMTGNTYVPHEDPHGAAKFQHTVVLGQHQPDVPQPKDHIIWSLCSLVYGNPFCFGMLAVYFSIKSRDRKMVGDLEGARKLGNTACCFNTVTLTLVILGLLFLFITYGIIIKRLIR